MGFRLLTTLVLAAHFAYLAYLLVGGFIAWRWPRMIWSHLAAAAWSVMVVALHLPCPLTSAEGWTRQRAGGAPLTMGFIDRYFEGVIYPERYTGLAQALVGLVVATSWAGFALRRRNRATNRQIPVDIPADIPTEITTDGRR